MNMKKLFSMRNVMLAGTLACVAAFTFAPLNADAATKAAKSSEITAEIDYEHETVTFRYIDAKKVFYSVAKKQTTDETKLKTWDDVKATEAEIDISTVVGTKEVFLYYKDGADGKVKELKIAASPKVTVDKKSDGININEGTFVLSNKDKIVTEGAIVQVKKGKRGEWSDWYKNKIVSAAGIDALAADHNFGPKHEGRLKKWQKSGATLYLRTAPTETMPASNEVTVKISKLSNGPKLTLDPVKLTAKMKGGTEYRVNQESAADNIGWEKVAKDNKDLIKSGVSLEELAHAGNVATSAALTIEYRTSADKKAASKITTTVISGQSVGPVAGTDFTAELKELGSKTKPATGVAIVSNNDNLEYMVVKKEATADLTKGWKALKKTKEAKLKPGSGKTQVADGDTIYFRIKGQKENAKKDIPFAWASAPTTYTVSLK